MKSSKIADVLELALIELEYAVADFMHQPSMISLEAKLRELETLRVKLSRADRSIENAITALVGSQPAAGVNPPNRRSRRGQFAA